MKPLKNRRDWLRDATLAIGAGIVGHSAHAKSFLPQRTTFIGEDVFSKLLKHAVKEGWNQGTVGDRMIRFGWALRGTPYQSYTLEIDDHIESPSVNFHGLDCWTFFEICLALARLIEIPKASYTTDDLLAEIEWTRYRAGVCQGNYLDRIHYLAEWYVDNEARGTIKNITRQLGQTEQIIGRKINEMTLLWQSYRYLRENASLRQAMKESEERVERLPFFYLPKARVAAAEIHIQNGDVIGIVTKADGGFCSHVGLAVRTKDGTTRLLHASSTHKQVWLDQSISQYLMSIGKHAGIIVGRSLPRANRVSDRAQYLANLQRLTT